MMIAEADILEALRAGDVRLPPLALELAGIAPTPGTGDSYRPDVYIDVRLGRDRLFRFVAELKSQATPRSFRQAMEQVTRFAEASERRPMVVLPFLSPERLEELEARGVSGVDLCGNGLVVVDDELIVMRTGNPNRYPAARKIRNVYQGVSSLVARVYLSRPEFPSVQAVLDEVTRRGGVVSLPTVSKVLKVLEEDLVIRRDGRASALLQADELLDRLAASHRPPRVSARKKYRWNGTPGELLQRLGEAGGEVVLTGAASVEHYSVMPREKLVQCYCPSIARIEQRLGADAEATPRFADLELVETPDRTAFFDSRGNGALAVASPVQCWLELQAGDKRQQDVAEQVRDRILGELRAIGWTPP